MGVAVAQAVQQSSSIQKVRAVSSLLCTYMSYDINICEKNTAFMN